MPGTVASFTSKLFPTTRLISSISFTLEFSHSLTSVPIDEDYITQLRDIAGVDVALITDNRIVGSTIDSETGLEQLIQNGFLDNLESPRIATLADTSIPLRLMGHVLVLDGRTQGAIIVGESGQDLVNIQRDILLALGSFAGIVLVGTSVIGVAALLNLARPITAMARAARLVSEGQLNQRVESSTFTRDEISELAENFNIMTERLSTLYNTLEQQVEERTHELEIARDQALDASKTKSAFLASMSHELRTPLNSIIGYSQMMSKGITGELTEKQYDFLERILRNGRHLLTLINDVLDIAKIEAGRMELISKPYNIHELFDGIYKENKILADNKNLDFEVEVSPDMPPVLVGDPDRIKQVAINLISNAIKFTDEGHVHVLVKKQGDLNWEISVTDTGIGIPSHMQEVIFDEFRQVDQSSRRKYGGTGLGLAIVRNLAVMMGGNVRVSSAIGVGSTFIVRTPLVVEEHVTI